MALGERPMGEQGKRTGQEAVGTSMVGGKPTVQGEQGKPTGKGEAETLTAEDRGTDKGEEEISTAEEREVVIFPPRR